MSFDQRDAVGTAQLIAAGEIRSVEVVQAAIERIDRFDDRINAVTWRRDDLAIAEAATVRPTTPLSGVPFLVKEALCATAGEPAHLGARFLASRGWTATRDSFLARRFRDAGLISLGHTNLPELALSPTTEPALHGPTHNPWRLGHSPGGSSGGSAAAVAAGYVTAAHGNDMGGSLRIPAAHCGLVGLKPTRARSSLGPDHGEYWWQSATEGVLVRTVRDAAAFLDQLAHRGPGDPYHTPRMHEPWLEALARPTPPLRLGVFDGGTDTDPAIRAQVAQAAEMLERAGHRLDRVDPPWLEDDAAWTAQSTLFVAHVAAELERIGRLVGERIHPDDVEPNTWFYARMGRRVDAIELIRASAEIHRFGRAVADWWSQLDVLLLPTTARLAPPHGVLSPDRLAIDGELRTDPYVRFTLPFNLTGQPAISIPGPALVDGLPVGLQLVGPWGEERALLGVAAQLQEAFDWPSRWPELVTS